MSKVYNSCVKENNSMVPNRYSSVSKPQLKLTPHSKLVVSLAIVHLCITKFYVESLGRGDQSLFAASMSHDTPRS